MALKSKKINSVMYQSYYAVTCVFLQRCIDADFTNREPTDCSVAVSALMPPTEYIISYVDKLYSDKMFCSLLDKVDKLPIFKQPYSTAMEMLVSRVHILESTDSVKNRSFDSTDIEGSNDVL